MSYDLPLTDDDRAALAEGAKITVIITRESPPPPEPSSTDVRETGKPILLDKPGTTYRLVEGITSKIWISGQDVTLRMEGHTSIGGIRLYAGPKYGDYDWGEKPLAEDFNLFGPGNIVTYGDCISGQYARRAWIDGISAECSGVDAACVRFGSNRFTLRNSLFISNVTETANRHSMPACIEGPNSIVDAEGCAVIGGNLGFDVGSKSWLRGLFISPSSFATNGYCVGLYRCDGATVEDCLLLPRNGRGILWNAGENHRAQNNVILAWDVPNKEYGTRLNACCLRSRYQSKGHLATGNTMLAVGGGKWCGASALYLSDNPGFTNTFENNWAAAVLVGEPDRDRYAKAITLEAQGKPGEPCWDVIRNNRFRSNHRLLSLSGYDSHDYGAFNVPLPQNAFVHFTGTYLCNDFADAAVARWESLALPWPEAQQRYDDIISTLRSLRAGISPDASHVYGDSVLYYGGSDVTVCGSGPYDDWKLDVKQRDTHPMTVRLEEECG